MEFIIFAKNSNKCRTHNMKRETINYVDMTYEKHVALNCLLHKHTGHIECTAIDTRNGLNRKGSSDMVYQYRIVIHTSNGFARVTPMVLLLITYIIYCTPIT